MVDIEGMAASTGQQMPARVNRALSSYLLFEKISTIFRNWKPEGKLQTEVFFCYLAMKQGTAIDFDWIRGHGYCELDDWVTFQDALDGRL